MEWAFRMGFVSPRIVVVLVNRYLSVVVLDWSDELSIIASNAVCSKLPGYVDGDYYWWLVEVPYLFSLKMLGI